MTQFFETIIHKKRIAGRTSATHKAMRPLWGVTWNLKGQRFKPLGTASMMVVSYHDQFGTERDAIELTCVTGRTDGNAIMYDDIRMSHNLAMQPFPGAMGRILDPRDESARVKHGQHPNGSWVRLALELDRVICKASEKNWMRPATPTLPSFKVGFRSMHDLKPEVTPALIEVIASHMGRSVKSVAQIPEADLKTLGKAHWPELWTPPGIGGNETGMWLIDYRFVPELTESQTIFEDFTSMFGVDVWNPIRDIMRVQIDNPTRECAVEQGIDIARMMEIIERGHDGSVNVREACDELHHSIAPLAVKETAEVFEMTETEFISEYDQAVDNLLLLRNCVRGSLGSYARHFSDAELNFAVHNPDAPLLLDIEDSKQLDVEDAVKLARQHLNQTKPLISASTTDDDLIKAVVCPHEPLVASNMCKMQVLYRDSQVNPEDAFRFNARTLERERVAAHLWAGPEWTPRKRKAVFDQGLVRKEVTSDCVCTRQLADATLETRSRLMPT